MVWIDDRQALMNPRDSGPTSYSLLRASASPR